MAYFPRRQPPGDQAVATEKAAMDRTAIVTGGVTGIGAAACKALSTAGYRVASTYFGNQATAEKFSEETRVPVCEWNADFDVCQREGMALSLEAA
jgi:NAD(P)-dependent dehydrogenase (short-subunit alcohol dehydrogenase family)